MTKNNNMEHCEQTCALRVVHYGRQVGCAHEPYCRTFHKNDPVCDAPKKPTKTMETKVCTVCGRELQLSQFSKSKTTKDGHENQCKECRCKRAKENRAAKRENDAKEKKLQKSAKSARMQETSKTSKTSKLKNEGECRTELSYLVGLERWEDADLVRYLREVRGYNVTAKKEIKTIVEL